MSREFEYSSLASASMRRGSRPRGSKVTWKTVMREGATRGGGWSRLRAFTKQMA